jgi:hypothetical protein
MPLPDIVYVVKPGDDNQELRFSLRTLRNLPHGRVFVAGYCPRWLKGVTPIPVRQAGTKFANSTGNLRAAAEHPEVSEDFLYFNDDFFVMSPVDRMPVLHRGPVSTVEDYYSTRGKGPYLEGLRGTRGLLLELGFDEPLSYELHVPMLLNKQRLLETLELGADLPVLHKRTLYGNVWAAGGKQIRDCKVLSRGWTFPKAAPFLSTAPLSFASGAVGQHIRARFPEPGPYEGLLTFH